MPRSIRPRRCTGPKWRAKPTTRLCLTELQPLARYVKAPGQLARRLAQIGVVERDAGIRLAGTLKAGQRLVSREGDLWRWDGFVAAAHAPTGAARRLAQRSRFAEIDGELTEARSDVDGQAPHA